MCIRDRLETCYNLKVSEGCGKVNQNICHSYVYVPSVLIVNKNEAFREHDETKGLIGSKCSLCTPSLQLTQYHTLHACLKCPASHNRLIVAALLTTIVLMRILLQCNYKEFTRI